MNELFPCTMNSTGEAIRPEETGSYGLAVVAGEREFSCAVLDFRKNKFLALHHCRTGAGYPGETPGSEAGAQTGFSAAILRALPWLNSRFRMIRIACVGQAATLVPEPLFIPEEKEKFLRFNFTPDPGDEIRAVHLVPLGAWQVFSLSPAVTRIAGELFPDQRIVPVTGLFIESILINYKNRLAKPQVFLHIRNRMFDLMIYDGREMSYFNTFLFDKAEDVAYYLIFVMEQLGYNPDTMPLVAFGPVDQCEGLPELLNRYVRHVAYGHRNEAYHFDRGFDDLPGHLHFPLLNFFSCGL